MAKLTDKGYILKTQNEWFEDGKSLHQSIDPDWNLDPSTPDGLKLATDSEILSNLDELGLEAYNSKDPSKATGIQLDAIAAVTGTIRGKGTFSTSSVNLTGVNGTVIVAGTLIESTENGSRWATDSDVSILGVTAVSVTAIDRGAIQASINTLTKIVKPISGLSSATNPAVATVGTNPDTDAELRIKRDKAVSIVGSNQVDSMYSVLANLDGVRRVKVYENDRFDPTDANGLPIHSTAVIVDGGTDADIAQALYIKKNPGTKQHSTSLPTTVSVISPVTGNQKDIVFNRPPPIDVALVYNITDDGSLPIGIEQLLKDATLSYVDGDLLPADAGFNQRGFDIGENVHAGRFYTPANSVIGIYGESYITSITVNGGVSVVIGFEELARFTDANISVVIT